MIWRLWISLVFTIPFVSAPVSAYEGIVIAVSDGDTVKVLDLNNQQHKIRVAGIDAPEKRQAFGQESKAGLSAMVMGRGVEVVGNKIDRYGRTVAKIMVASASCSASDCAKSIDAGLQQVATGMAWWYQKYAKDQLPEDRRKYEQVELGARDRGIGLWSAREPMPPWEWRHQKHEFQKQHEF